MLQQKSLTSLPILLFAFALLFIGPACAPQIGDSCDHDGDCPQGSICERTVEEGLCTIRNCQPGECPSGSVCIGFDRQNAFCMQSCEIDDDCREGHQCLEDASASTNYCFSTD